MTHPLEHLEGYQKFRTLLSELFQLDLADLDFGLYRVLKQRRRAIEDYFAKELPERLYQHIHALSQQAKADLEAELRAATDKLRQLTPNAIEPDGSQTPIADTLAQAGGQIGNLIDRIRQIRGILGEQVLAENQVNDVLLLVHDFFRRYYDEGDFIPQPRFSFGEGYAIESYGDRGLAPLPQDFPGAIYRGEDVYFHWPTRGMHYAKSDTYLKNYSFRVETQGLEPQTFTVQFVLAHVEAVRDNNRASRYFFPKPEVKLEGHTLTIPFDYRSKREGDPANQEKILEAALPAVLAAIPDPGLRAALENTGDNGRGLLYRRARHFSALGSKDFFIHPHLEDFLQAELDYFTKSQALRQAELDNDHVLRRRLATLKAFRGIAQDLIRFLGQLERIQAQLFEKKRLVYRTDYIVPIRHIPQRLWPEILSNKAQIRYWQEDMGLAEITQATLETHPSLPVYTGHFDPSFARRLLAALGERWDLDEATDGVLVHAENYGALRTLEARWREGIKVIYIDPPYNTKSSEIPYKNGFKHATFASLIEGRVRPARDYLSQEGVMLVSIDLEERTVVEHVLRDTFGSWNQVEELIWAMNTTNSQVPTYSTNHEYVLVWAKDLPTVASDPQMFREPKPGYEEVMALIEELNPSYPPLSEVEKALRELYQRHQAEYRQQVEAQGLKWEEEKKNDPWKGIYPYKRAEYRNAKGELVPEERAREERASIWVWQEDNLAMPAGKQAASTKDPSSPNYRFYKPLHSITGRPVPHPKSGWKLPYEQRDLEEGRSFRELDAQGRIVWGQDEQKVPRIKRFLHEVETNVGKSVIVDYSDGEKETSALFGRSGVFFAPKPTSLIMRLLQQTTPYKEGMVLDYFGGSGTTAHAVIRLNREDGGRRKFILVEMGDHFDTVVLRRVQKVMYAPAWADGRPKPEPVVESKVHQPSLESKGGARPLPHWMECSPRLIKVLRLESYEDALFNLQTEPSSREAAYAENLSAVERPHEFLIRENAYLLSYFAEVLQDGNPALLRPMLNGEVLTEWHHPEAIRIRRPEKGGYQEEEVDWLETAALWLGLRIRKYAEMEANGHLYRVMYATSLDGAQPVALILRERKPDLDLHAERVWLEQTFPGHRVILNAPPVAAFEALEEVLLDAMQEGPK
jgi:adenine-specific DNA-methyltransferase